MTYSDRLNFHYTKVVIKNAQKAMAMRTRILRTSSSGPGYTMTKSVGLRTIRCTAFKVLTLCYESLVGAYYRNHGHRKASCLE